MMVRTRSILQRSESELRDLGWHLGLCMLRMFAAKLVAGSAVLLCAVWAGSQCCSCPLVPCVGRYHSGPPKEGWSYVWPNNGTTRLVDVQNAAGFTPLHYAVWVGRKEAIQVRPDVWLPI